MSQTTDHKTNSVPKKPSKSKLASMLASGDFKRVAELTGYEFKSSSPLQRIAEFYAANNIISVHQKDPIL